MNTFPGPSSNYNKIEQKTIENGKLQVVESRFECPICLNCLRNPLLTTCGHRFCEECIHKWLKHDDGSCPIDGQLLSVNSDLFPDNYTRREIAQQKVNCPVEDCTEQLALIEAEKHIAEYHQNVLCEEESINCTFHDIGCTDVFTTQQQLRSHLDGQLHHHLAILSSAYGRITSQLNKPLPDNVKEEEAKMWNPEPKQNKDQVEPSQNLIRTLYERIIVLEQSNREHEIQLSGLRTKVSKLIEENTVMKEEWPLRYCNGVYVWSIDNFTKKYSSMVEDKYPIFSPGFYTSYFGYRFCARLNLSIEDRNYFTLLIHLMQGQNDAALDWPFCGQISFTLIHPSNSEKSVKETMASRPELEAFKRPTHERSLRAFGYNNFVLVSDVFKLGFLNNDCVTIKMRVQETMPFTRSGFWSLSSTPELSSYN